MLSRYLRENISADVDVIMTDDFAGYPKALHDAGVLRERKTIKHKDGIYAVGDIYTNTVESAFSLLKRGIAGTRHKTARNSCKPTLTKCAFDSTSVKTVSCFAIRFSGCWKRSTSNTKH